MTMQQEDQSANGCPVQGLVRMLSARWCMEIFRKAVDGPIRFNSLLREFPGSNRQSLASALKSLEEQGIVGRKVIRLKPLHVEYELCEKGRELVPIFRQLEQLNKS
jgi:DNA-binding HxlR family transcriptional regulator